MTNRYRLDNKTALVTGCTSGIGLAIADELIALARRSSVWRGPRIG